MQLSTKKIAALRNNKYTAFFILMAYSFIAMLFFTKSSPLFFLNDWVDANAFFTMGKGMMNGLVLYRDLFEQKGPLLYFIHGIAYLFSNTTFLGVYIFESIGLGISMFMLYKIAILYEGRWKSLWISIMFPTLLLQKPFFKLGDSAEEFVTPFIMGLIYFIFVFMRSNLRVKPRWFFIQGLLMGCVFWIKYTLIGSWIGFFLMVFFILMYKKEFRLLGKYILYSLLGFAAAALPWLIYFGVNHALTDLFDVYFYFNMFSYPATETMLHKLFNILMVFTSSFTKEPILYCFVFFGMGTVIIMDRLLGKIEGKLLILASFMCNIAAAFYGGKTYIYYYLILLPYTCIGLLELMHRVLKPKSTRSICKNLWTTALLFMFSIVITFCFNQNIRETRFNTSSDYIQIVEKGDTPVGKPAQYVFAEIMNQQDNPTMLNYGTIDGGFYTVADILPINRYFMKQNISHKAYPELMDEQNQLVADKAVDFIVLRGNLGDSLKDRATDTMLQNYTLVSTHSQRNEGIDRTYFLLQKKPD